MLAYCIERPRHREGKGLRFVLRVGTQQKGGAVSISETRSQADLSNPPKYLAREDYSVASIYHERVRKLKYSGDCRWKAADWDELLAAAHATGRLFWREELGAGGRRQRYINRSPPARRSG